jgi:hypothetical protein
MADAIQEALDVALRVAEALEAVGARLLGRTRQSVDSGRHRVLRQHFASIKMESRGECLSQDELLRESANP